MAIVTYAQNLQVNTASLFDLLFIILAMCLYTFFTDTPIGDMDISLVDINMVKKIYPHKTVITLQGIIGNRVIFVKIKCDNIFKTQLLLFVYTYQFSI